MCRLLAYLGSTVSLEKLIYQPEHSLVVQSYQPQEMLSGVVNADGFGVGWYHPEKEAEAFTYKNTLPIWNDINLPSLSRYVDSQCIVSYIRSATPGQALDFSNCQPFHYQRLLFTHNGRIDKFRQTLYKQIRNLLSDKIYNQIYGTTDSEHIFALLLEHLEKNPGKTLEQALQITLIDLAQLAQEHQTYLHANIVISDGKRLIASRFTTKPPAPSLYYFQGNKEDTNFPNSIIIASEPLFAGNWTHCPENSIISAGENGDIRVEQI